MNGDRLVEKLQPVLISTSLQRGESVAGSIRSTVSTVSFEAVKTAHSHHLVVTTSLQRGANEISRTRLKAILPRIVYHQAKVGYEQTGSARGPAGFYSP